jgi:asparagine synthetase A
MVPSGYWTQKKISAVAKTWTQRKQPKVEEELHLTQILPADYKSVNIAEIVKKQTHLDSDERNKLQTVQHDFQDLFAGERGNYNGDPITLELLPGSKPFLCKALFHT